MAEGVGFEPTKAFTPLRFSRPVQSTTLPPLQMSFTGYRVKVSANRKNFIFFTLSAPAERRSFDP